MTESFREDDLNITALKLSSDNPRLLDKIYTRQLDLINRMINEKLMPLIESIAERGWITHERLWVVPENSTTPKKNLYVVCEGNRRVASLKLLHNPKLATRHNDERKIKSIIKKYNKELPSMIPCMIGGDSTDFRDWMPLQHEGEKDGVGRRPWGPLSSEKWRRGQNEKRRYGYSLELYELAIREHWIADENCFATTTISRIIKSKVLKNHFQYKLGKEDCFLKNMSKEKMYILKRLVQDFALGPSQSKKIYDARNNEVIAGYIENVMLDFNQSINENPRPLQQECQSQTLQSQTHNQIESLKVPQAPKEPRALREGDPLAKNYADLSIANDRANQIFDELKYIRLDKARNAAAILVRVLVELIVLDDKNPVVLSHLSRKRESGAAKQQNRLTLKKAILGLLESMGGSDLSKDEVFANSVSMMRVEVGNKSSLLSPDVLHIFVHDIKYMPTERNLRELWANYYNFLECVCRFYASRSD